MGFLLGFEHSTSISSVPDHASRIRDVVLVRRTFSSGNPRGSEIWDGEGMGRGWKWGDQFTSNLGPGWTGSYHTKEGFQVSKREGREAKGNQQGEVRIRGLRHVMLSTYTYVHNNCL
jgi:hypothetical protein